MNTAYSFTILRYVHDTTSGEFVNVGVVVVAPSTRFVSAHFRKTYGRVSKLFHGMDTGAFRSMMPRLQSLFDARCKQILHELPFQKTPADALALATSILPNDDSSLQWSSPGGGVAEDLEVTAQELFARYVLRYDDTPHRDQRTEEDIWRNYSHELTSLRVMDRLHSKTIVVTDDSFEFKLAWKNDVWHCLEPISFDLVTGEGIREKAHKWLGRLSSINGSREDFLVHFLTAKPQDESLHGAYSNAISILKKLENRVEIVQEADFPASARRFAENILAHTSEAGD